MCASMLSCFSHVWLFETPWTVFACVCVFCLTLCDLVDYSSPGPSAWDSPGKNTGVGFHTILQGIFLTQGIELEPLMSPVLTCGFFTTSTTCKAPVFLIETINYCKRMNSKIKINRIIIVLLFLFSPSVMSDFLQPHELQHNRLPCPSLSPRAYSNSYPLSQQCPATISSSVDPVSSCPQSSQHQVARVLEL